MEIEEYKYWPKLEFEYDPIEVISIDSNNKKSYDSQVSCKFPPLYCNHKCCVEQQTTFKEIYMEWRIAHDRIREQEAEIRKKNALIQQLEIDTDLLRKNLAMEASDRRIIQIRHRYKGMIAENKILKQERDIAQKKIKELEESLASAESQIQSMLSAQETGRSFDFVEENRNLRSEIQAVKLICARKKETLEQSMKCLSHAQHFCLVAINMMKSKGLYEGFEVGTQKFGWWELLELMGTPSAENLEKLEKKIEEMNMVNDLMKKSS